MADQLSNYSCPNCGGPLQWDAESQKLKCEYCDSLFTQSEVDQFYTDKEKAAAASDIPFEEKNDIFNDSSLRYYHCPTCGAEITADENTAVTKCPYCDNPLVVAKQFTAKKPKYVLPFQVDKKKAVEILNDYCKDKPFLPKCFTEQSHLEEVKGVYVPFWLYDATIHADMVFRGERVHVHHRGDDEITETEIYHIVRRGDVHFDKVPADASKTMRDDYMDALEPFDYSKMQEFSTMYLAGYMADSYDVEAKENQARVDLRMKNTVEQTLRESVMGYSSIMPIRSDLYRDQGVANYAFLPVWLLVTKWNGKTFLFAVNGQSGKIVGELPSDSSLVFMSFLKTFVITMVALFAALMIL